MTKLTAEDRVMLLQCLWCKERDLEQAIKLREDLEFDKDILEKYKQDLEHVKRLGDDFLNWGI